MNQDQCDKAFEKQWDVDCNIHPGLKPLCKTFFQAAYELREAEVKRLRSALKRYASDEFWMKVGEYDRCHQMDWGDIAKAALAETKEEE